MPGGTFELLAGLERLGPVELESYWIDRFEVTNQQFKQFVDNGGYQKQDYWKHEFLKEGAVLSWEEAMAEFRDKTGRPGPSTWELGTYPDGQQDFPVSGVSWHEAAAYAEFVGKALPTAYHWYKAAAIPIQHYSVHLSNFTGEGPSAVGSHDGIRPFGTFDMAGNVKEWCWNATGNKRLILGGAWGDPTALFAFRDGLLPFDRFPTNGFRCVKYDDAEAVTAEMTQPLAPPARDLRKDKPVPENIFEIYRAMFSYDRANLNEKIELIDESPEHWTRETIVFNAAYVDEPMAAFLYLPKGLLPPYQGVVFFPSISVAQAGASGPGAYTMVRIETIVRSGRAVLFPRYLSTHELNVSGSLFNGADPLSMTVRDQIIMGVKAARRSIDYLETREDIDHDKLGYFGASNGAWQGSILLAVEDRFKAAVLFNGGFLLLKLRQEVDQLNFIPRITVPVLMLNGRFDYIFPLDLSQLPMFNLLGTPEKDKRHVLSDTGHGRHLTNQEIREMLDWYDRYLGPVKKKPPV